MLRLARAIRTPSLDDRAASGQHGGELQLVSKSKEFCVEYTDTPAVESPEQPVAPNQGPGFLHTAEGAASDMVAVMLSIVPGLGHIYKGYRLIGVLLLFIGTPAAVASALLIATGTAGFGFFLLPVYWIAVMVHVWAIPDRIAPHLSDEGEQY
ncbi:MAG TPA: hypothetical protein VGI85_12520 [Chthoniobacterales bacterium]